MPGAISPQPIDNDGPPSHVIGVYHITHPRSASNLFQNMMSKQPGYQNSGYKLYDAALGTMMGLERGPLSAWPEEREALYEAYRKGWEAMLDECEDAKRNGKKVFIKEHAYFINGPDTIFSSFYPEDAATLPRITLSLRNASPSEPVKHTNPTPIPDAFFLTMQPIFQIRHPMLMYPSAIRAQRAINLGGDPASNFGRFTLSLQRQRKLYDWYLEHGAAVGIVPRVIDADDVMKSPEAVRKLCRQTGLDPDAVAYEWETRVVEDFRISRFLSTINNSRGILPGFAAEGLDMEEEKEKWRKEFGEKDAGEIAKRVDESMGDYLYLWERRTKEEMKDEGLAP
ncbi:hypothetical protein PtrEW4_009673 [Pyrenophora tritici-repentis]|uniref:Uncharacterized protein n=3 Tax=Pyrenophora tritici-repentis TaxID=45151 RepID=A0A922N753_9PLEO|nr:uncharacterized protein PTRG_06008 [Pyrenophora tritici-repentis Pt-1C-BFP]KAI1510142.1 hypothetical protein Ptr86124_011180 [Pyrenophora tritici-repentis]EDU48928.1 conserved hypothetical protein [Pyrenophora tritici-repentis Pt-1C-BFP]KAI1562974.1 hypothetical protein PtrEW4_009673 [Pyrenophora tritici-repentis]KAI1663892.1 hypothetical protein L13192_11833 [Pyrenophora tritici-repentis]KAI1683124.1 hypothetical protein KJE20_07856 [Pyrenophora tritici-repentis]